MRKWAVRSGLAVVVLAVLYLGVSFYVANAALKAEVNAIEERPEQYGLRYEDVAFTPRAGDRITLRGWWIPVANPAGTIIWVHGLDSKRDARITLLADLHTLGFSVLAFDLRGHGESDKAAMGAGIREQEDVLGAVDFLTNEKGVVPGTIGLMGLSYGAAIVLLAAPREPAVAAVFADSSFASLTEVMVTEVADRTFLPPWGASLLRPGIVLAARLFKGLDVDMGAPLETVDDIGYPVVFAHCDADERIPPSHGERLKANAAQGSELVRFPGCAHGKAYEEQPQAYLELALLYFGSRLGGPTGLSPDELVALVDPADFRDAGATGEINVGLQDLLAVAEAIDPSQVTGVKTWYAAVFQATGAEDASVVLAVMHFQNSTGARRQFDVMLADSGKEMAADPIGERSATDRLDADGVGSILLVLKGDKVLALHTAFDPGAKPLVSHEGLLRLGRAAASRL